jgi:uncharacterized Zn-binding protein involved in type VI secretion
MRDELIAVLGDRTTHGGQIISASGTGRQTIDGIPVACVGDRVLCPQKGHTNCIIIQGDPNSTLDGKEIAYNGCLCSCGARVIAGRQTRSTVSVDYEGGGRGAANGARGIQTADATPGISAEEARMLAEQNEQDKKCQCGGPHPLKIVGEEVKQIGGYTGKLRAPGMLFKMDESPRRIDARTLENSRRIRRWAREASAHHEIPYVMLAVLLEQENGQNVSAWRRFGQGYERFLQFSGAVIKDATGIPVPGADGSTGIINMIRATYLKTKKHTQEKYARPLLPSNKQSIDSGFVGVDVEADLYYGAAYIRYLIDEDGTSSCTKGEITLEQVQNAFTRYNGPPSENNTAPIGYGQAAMNKLLGAYKGTKVLYFYE